jgi:hypothetical protein
MDDAGVKPPRPSVVGSGLRERDPHLRSAPSSTLTADSQTASRVVLEVVCDRGVALDAGAHLQDDARARSRCGSR